MISKDTIALVRDRTDILSVISESVPSLKKRGRRFVGLCPFHKEKTPSFHVNPDTGHYHCFGCKEGGDVFTFLERIEGYAFIEAVRALAERAGIAVEETAGADSREADRHKKEREAHYGALQMAAAFYETQLREHPHRGHAIAELGRRGLLPDAEVVQAFRIGYASPGWDGLASFFKRQGVSPAVAEAVGLTVPRSSGSGYYDRFRHRLMFAVIDTQGRVVAFSGRALPPIPEEEDARAGQGRESNEPPPKYINSPESPVYTKGATVFGLWQARHVIRQKESTVLVEGNFDVVTLHAHGVQNAVAPLGTAFTIDQAKLLRRYAVDVTILFDGDTAGRKAARAAEEPCEKAGLEAKVALLPDRSDPDEFVRTKGSEALAHTLGSARGLLEYLIDVELDDTFNAADLREQRTRVDRIGTVLSRQIDPVVRGMAKAYADKVASRLDLVRSAPNAFDALVRKIASAMGTTRVVRGPSPHEARVTSRPPGQEERKAIVGAILEFPALVEDSEVARVSSLLEGESARIVAAVAGNLRMSPRGEKVLNAADFLAQMSPRIQAFARERLASPAHETIEEARTTVVANAKKLRETNIARETLETAREQERDTSDWEAQVNRANDASARVRERHGLGRG
jgi:DNA primase